MLNPPLYIFQNFKKTYIIQNFKKYIYIFQNKKLIIFVKWIGFEFKFQITKDRKVY